MCHFLWLYSSSSTASSVVSSPPPSSSAVSGSAAGMSLATTCPDWDGCKYTAYSNSFKTLSPQTHTPLPFPLRNILPANLHPPPFFAPCSLSIKPPHFMDNRSKFPHSSMKMPHFMDNLINSVPLSTKSPIFMDNRSEFPIHP